MKAVYNGIKMSLLYKIIIKFLFIFQAVIFEHMSDKYDLYSHKKKLIT